MASSSKQQLLQDSKQRLLLLLEKKPEKIPSILKFLQDTPPHAEVQDLIPLDELAIRVELIDSIIKKLENVPATLPINDFSFSTLLVTPLHVLKRLNQLEEKIQHALLYDLLDAAKQTSGHTVKGVLDIFLAKNKVMAKSNEKEKEKRRRYDGNACKVLGTANPEVCHIIPWSSSKDTTVVETFRQGLTNMMKTLELITDDNGREASLAQIQAETMGLTNLFCSAPGCSDKAWNMVCLNRQLHDWWGRAQIGFRPLGILDGDTANEKKVQVQLYWMPTNLRPNRTTVPYTTQVLQRDVDKLKDRLNEIHTRPQAAAETGGRYAACRIALGDPSLPGHPVMTGDIFEWSVETADAEKMKRAFELQWALIRITAIAGGAGPRTLDEDDEDQGPGVEEWIASLPPPELMEHVPD